MNKLAIFLLLLLSSIANAQTQQNLTVAQGFRMLEYNRTGVDAYLKKNHYSFYNQNNNFYQFNKSTSVSSYEFTVAYNSGKVTAISWDEFIGNMRYITSELEGMGFKMVSSSSNPYNGREIFGFDNLKRNLLVSLITKGNYFTVTLGLKNPNKPYITQKVYDSISLKKEKAERAEVTIEERQNYTLAKQKLDGLIAKYKSGYLVYEKSSDNVSNIDNINYLPSSETKLDLITNRVTIECLGDSLIKVLPKYFSDEDIYFVIANDGRLLRFENKDKDKVVDLSVHPYLKQWINIQGQYELVVGGKTFPVSYRFPAIKLENKNYVAENLYYFSVGNKEIEFITDDHILNSDFYNNIPGLEKKTFFKYDKQKVQSQILALCSVKKVGEVKKISNVGKSSGLGLGVGVLKMATGIPFGGGDKRAINDNLFRFIDGTEKQSFSIKGLAGNVKIDAADVKELDKIFALEVFNPHKGKFIKVR